MQNGTSLARVIDAAAFAAYAHRNQRRKDEQETPYINHPLALLRILAIEGGIDDVDVLCAAALHDFLEDCCGDDREWTLEQGRRLLGERFGETALAYVEAVTDDKALPKAERKRLQVEHAAHISREAKLVKLADKICNLRDILASPPVHWPLQRQQAYFDWSAQVIAGVRGVHPQLEAVFDTLYARRPGQG